MAIGRVICGEILDHLPADDPAAIRSRLDLLAINALMGNTRWVRRALRRAIGENAEKFVGSGRPKIRLVEIGAGGGRLCQRISDWFPEAQVTGLDLAPRPPELPRAISWGQGDLFDKLPSCLGDVLVGALILHHFSDERLIRIGRMLQDYRVVCFCEPWRARLPHFFGAVLQPFCGKVTRHDLHVSIDAGFVCGEMPRLLGLENWHVEEFLDWRGSVRLLAWKE
ncbi:MAG TPA: class I SAM-dependent methyltransferase [Terrimicrobiaceae bacterium]